jgi:hypothetical protein
MLGAFARARATGSGRVEEDLGGVRAFKSNAA